MPDDAQGAGFAASEGSFGGESLCWIAGQIVPERDAALPVRDRLVRVGYGFFETVRVVRGRPFRLAAHLERLYEVAEAPYEDVASIVRGLVAAYGPYDAVLRIVVSGGDPPSLPAQTFVTIGPPRAPAPSAAERALGAALVVTDVRTNPRSRLAGRKTTSRLEHYLARDEAWRARAIDALFLDPAGDVAEGSVTNVFWAFGGRLYTPALAMGIRPGVVREIVLELAAGRAIPVEQGRFPLAALLAADEVFLTNALIGVLPIARVGETSIRSCPGQTTTVLAAGLEELVLRECGPVAG